MIGLSPIKLKTLNHLINAKQYELIDVICTCKTTPVDNIIFYDVAIVYCFINNPSSKCQYRIAAIPPSRKEYANMLTLQITDYINSSTT